MIEIGVIDRKNSTALRGIAITIIVLAHCFGSFFRYFTPLGGIGVCIFLFLSGYGVNESWIKNGGGGYFLKKIKKVWMPYFILISVVSLIVGTNIRTFLLDISLLSPSYWYLRYLFVCYIAYYIISKTLPRYKLLFLFLCGITSMVFCGGVEGEQPVSFFLGVLISERKSVKIRKRIVWAFVTLLFVFGIAALLFKQCGYYREIESGAHSIQNQLFVNFTNTVVKTSLAMAVVLLSMLILRISDIGFFAFIGSISYELYLVHMQFIHYIQGSPMILVATIIASILISWFFYAITQKLIDKIG